MVGHSEEVRKGIKLSIYFLAKVAAESQQAGNTTPVGSADYRRKGAYALFKKKLRVVSGLSE